MTRTLHQDGSVCRRDLRTRVREGLEDLFMVVVLFGGSLLLLWLTRC